jgi:hypothetical protein
MGETTKSGSRENLGAFPFEDPDEKKGDRRQADEDHEPVRVRILPEIVFFFGMRPDLSS